MSFKSVSEPEKNVRVIEFGCDRKTFDEAVTAVYRRKAPKLSVPGFRPGKAPQHFIEKMYGSGIFYEDAVNDMIPALYPDALKESGLEPVSRPEFDLVELNDEGLTLSAKFYVKPEVKIDGYKGLTVKKVINEVTDEAVDSEIKTVRERNGRSIEVTDRPAQNGDTVSIDYSGSVDGELFEGGTAEKQSLRLGSGQFIPGFEDQVAGHSVGDEFDVNVTFPEDYGAKELAGKAAVFKCKLHAINEREIPELDDEFVADVSEFNTVDEYKADVRAKLEKREADRADNEAKDEIIDKLVEALDADIPAVMFDNEVENELQNYDTRLRSQGLSLEMYTQYTGMTVDQLKEQFRPGAERQVKLRLALEAIAAQENLEVTEDETNAEYEDIAKAYNMKVEEVKDRILAEDIKADLKVKKAMELVEAAATYTAE
ncbi:MAG: trigger factor [Clostridia bacterium]|nr:trigger factor [Clostridia bacterium]